MASFKSSILQEEAKMHWDTETELYKVSKTILRFQKWSLIIGVCAINGVLTWASWQYSKFYYIFLPLLGANTFLQAFMIVSLVGHYIFKSVKSWFRKEDDAIPDNPERIVMLLPCYNETRTEIERSLDSLVAQKELDSHPRLIVIIVDGNAKGRGMEKTTQEYLLEDILPVGNFTDFENGYRARDGLFMGCTVQEGWYKGLPYVFIGKRYNQGKRDSLCFIRSFLYHFQSRSADIRTMFNPGLFDYLGNFFVNNGLNEVDYLVGMDADTVFDDYCIYEMVKAIRRAGPKVVGVCGHVCVDFDGYNFGFWGLYQSVEYSLTQGLRRMFQSRITGKVNCLPG
jgi:chitin synthase